MAKAQSTVRCLFASWMLCVASLAAVGCATHRAAAPTATATTAAAPPARVFLNVRDDYPADRPASAQVVLGNTGDMALKYFIERYDSWSNWRWHITDAHGQPVDVKPGPVFSSVRFQQLAPGAAVVEEFDLRAKFHLTSGTYSVFVERLVWSRGGQQFLARSPEFHVRISAP